MNERQYVLVRAKTKARKQHVEKKGNVYHIAVTEKPERGVANRRIREILSHELHCNLSALRMVKGGTTPSKTFLFIP